MFQAALFDPRRDHTNQAQLPFPCLQHLTFVPNFKDRTIILNAFYATQQIFVKGYGNYLGLARLGAFLASQTQLSLERVVCYAGIAKMDKRPLEPALKELTTICSSLTNFEAEAISQ